MHSPDKTAGALGKVSARFYNGSTPKQAVLGKRRRTRACSTNVRDLQSRGRDGLRMLLLPKENLSELSETGARNASDVHDLLGRKDSASALKVRGSLVRQGRKNGGPPDDKHSEPGFSHDTTRKIDGRETRESKYRQQPTGSRRCDGTTRVSPSPRRNHGRAPGIQRREACHRRNCGFLDGHINGCLAGRRGRNGVKRRYHMSRTRRAFSKRQFWSTKIPDKESPCTDWQTCLAELGKSVTICRPYRQEAEGGREFGQWKICRR